MSVPAASAPRAASSATAGVQALRDFLRAPSKIRGDFWAKVRETVDREHAIAQRLEAEGAPAPRGYLSTGPRWDADWSRRARIWRIGEERGFRDTALNSATIARLKAIPASEYVERLVGEEVPRSGKINCPLPEHDERTPSFHVKGLYWRCYGCEAHGTIYDLAGRLWDIIPRGDGFAEVHGKLMEVFG